jgi:hypothetical protein
LDIENLITERYTGKYFYDEIQGMADATGVDHKVILPPIKLNDI